MQNHDLKPFDPYASDPSAKIVLTPKDFTDHFNKPWANCMISGNETT